MTAPDVNKTIQRALLRWYARHQRDLPWRGVDDPWAVWVSEIMLQQTQVATIRERFGPFMARFPTVRSLAAADLDGVLKAWEGLGYYGRARNLHRAAQEVVATLDGKIPETGAELSKLAGIGPYTAGAIASIAFGADEPVLDGNVTRVLCRLFHVTSDAKAAGTIKRLWSLARELTPAGKASFFNQALMDLGATVCTPRAPGCLVCPVRKVCRAYDRGDQETLPRKPKRKKTPHWDVAVAVVQKGARFLIARRPEEGLLGGLWEFPGGKREGEETLEDCAIRELREEVNVRAEVVRHLVTVNHAYTHFRVTLHAYLCRHVSGRPKAIACTAWKWVSLDELDRYAFPAGTHKILRALRGQ